MANTWNFINPQPVDPNDPDPNSPRGGYYTPQFPPGPSIPTPNVWSMGYHPNKEIEILSDDQETAYVTWKFVKDRPTWYQDGVDLLVSDEES